MIGVVILAGRGFPVREDDEGPVGNGVAVWPDEETAQAWIDKRPARTRDTFVIVPLVEAS